VTPLKASFESTLSRVPPHLRRYVVQQDYGAYDEVSQAVWRFVTLHAYARLRHTAVPEYLDGLGKAGMSVDRIPRIEAMDASLAEYGWGAVCVDGFIPPRAFQAFQALGILPIAADIRTHQHLSYTPAPDIIHEAAGHAPILVNTEYASYLRRIGEVGSRAFTKPQDDEAYRAIYRLSEIKESPNATPAQVTAAERELADTLARTGEPSEAARLSRLYWWTAEYGLCGTVKDYRLYGAGLLSSLWESHSCHSERVRKLPLGIECLDVGYDITQEQPQLFVTPDFSALHGVLEQAERQLACSVGGTAALRVAVESRELATLELEGVAVCGVVERVLERDDTAAALLLSGRLGVALDGNCRVLDDAQHRKLTGCVVLGSSLDGRSLRDWAMNLPAEAGARLDLRTTLGVEMSGDFVTWHTFPSVLEVRNVELRAREEVLHRGPDPIWVVLAPHVRTARAGACADSYFPATEFMERRVPRASNRPPDLLRLNALYVRSIEAWRAHHGPAVLEVFEAIHAELERSFPEEWLLRWNLLESLDKAGEHGVLSHELERELEKLEHFFREREPIMTGLGRLRGMRHRGAT
jgi:phenylalanine-4-hydroxylase